MYKGIAAATASIGVFTFTAGVLFPLLSFILERHGEDSAFIGLSGAAMPLGILFGSIVLPALARRFGAFRLCLTAYIATAAIILLIALTRNFWLWFPLRFALGFAINVMFVISETWINSLAPSKHRGRILGLYVTVAALGFAAGPVVLGLTGTEGPLPFAIAILSPFAALPLLLSARDVLPNAFDDDQGGNVAAFARAAPILLAVVCIVALYDQTALVLFPVYGLGSGLDETTTNLALSVTVLGNVALQIPLGIAAERYDRRIILLILCALTAIGFALLPLVIGGLAAWPLLFAIGAFGFGGFTVVMVELGERFSGSMLLAGNAAFAMAWGTGGIIGPPITGAAMELVGPQGYPATASALFAMLMILLLVFPLVGIRKRLPA